MKVVAVSFLFMIALLSACTTVTKRQVLSLQSNQRDALYKLGSWEFSGRLAILAGQDSWSAAISWRHIPDKEEIKLAGPLGQTAALIELTDKTVKIDRGNGDLQSSNDPEAFVSQQLGMFVPLRSLGFWALGLVKPDQDSQLMDGGFLQNGWYVDFVELQTVGAWTMPKKMTVMSGKVKLKLIIDHWKLDDVATLQ